MSVIAVVNRKGGSGKSTLATHLAAHFANLSVPVMLGDVDRQQSTQSWLRSRALRDLPRSAPIVGWAVDPKRVLRPPAGVHHVILDTPGGLRGFDLARVVAFADVILMPVCNSIFDRESAGDCFVELMALPRVASGRCKVAAVGMRLDARTRAAETLQAWARGPEAALHRRAARGAGLRALRRAGPDGVRSARGAGAGGSRAMELDRRLARAGAADRAPAGAARQRVGGPARGRDGRERIDASTRRSCDSNRARRPSLRPCPPPCRRGWHGDDSSDCRRPHRRRRRRERRAPTAPLRRGCACTPTSPRPRGRRRRLTPAAINAPAGRERTGASPRAGGARSPARAPALEIAAATPGLRLTNLFGWLTAPRFLHRNT